MIGGYNEEGPTKAERMSFLRSYSSLAIVDIDEI
jgi:hypothetical protein